MKNKVQNTFTSNIPISNEKVTIEFTSNIVKLGSKVTSDDWLSKTLSLSLVSRTGP